MNSVAEISVSVSLLMSSMDHLNNTLLPWTRLNSLGGVVCPSFGWNAGNSSAFSLLWVSNMFSCSYSALPCWKGSCPVFYHHMGIAAEGRDDSHPQGTGLLQRSLPFSAVKSMRWAQRISVVRLPWLPALSPCLGWAGFVWKLVKLLVPHISMGSFIFANPCITLWHQKMCLQSSVEDQENDFMGGEVCWCWIYLASNLSSFNTAP